MIARVERSLEFDSQLSSHAHLLPERVQEDRATRSSACIQETYAGDFSCLLRASERARRKEHSAKSKDRDLFLHVSFSVLLPLPLGEDRGEGSAF